MNITVIDNLLAELKELDRIFSESKEAEKRLQKEVFEYSKNAQFYSYKIETLIDKIEDLDAPLSFRLELLDSLKNSLYQDYGSSGRASNAISSLIHKFISKLRGFDLVEKASDIKQSELSKYYIVYKDAVRKEYIDISDEELAEIKLRQALEVRHFRRILNEYADDPSLDRDTVIKLISMLENHVAPKKNLTQSE